MPSYLSGQQENSLSASLWFNVERKCHFHRKESLGTMSARAEAENRWHTVAEECSVENKLQT